MFHDTIPAGINRESSGLMYIGLGEDNLHQFAKRHKRNQFLGSTGVAQCPRPKRHQDLNNQRTAQHLNRPMPLYATSLVQKKIIPTPNRT